MTAPTTSSVTRRLANPRRTTLAAVRERSRCEVHGAGCRGTATRLSDGVATCSVCRPA